MSDTIRLEPGTGLGRLAACMRVATYVIAGTMVVLAFALTVGPSVLPYQPFVVLTGSMAPGIPVGSVVVAVPVARGDLAVGDVITYQRVEEPDLAVTHRITSLRAVPGGLVARTKGDANDVPDPWEVHLSPTVLRAVGAVPLVGYAIYFAQSERGRVVTLGLPLAALGALAIRDRFVARRAVPESAPHRVPPATLAS